METLIRSSVRVATLPIDLFSGSAAQSVIMSATFRLQGTLLSETFSPPGHWSNGVAECCRHQGQARCSEAFPLTTRRCDSTIFRERLCRLPQRLDRSLPTDVVACLSDCVSLPRDSVACLSGWVSSQQICRLPQRLCRLPPRVGRSKLMYIFAIAWP